MTSPSDEERIPGEFVADLWGWFLALAPIVVVLGALYVGYQKYDDWKFQKGVQEAVCKAEFERGQLSYECAKRVYGK